jgi:hypothetical protein
VWDGRAAHPHDAQQILLNRAQPDSIVEIEARTEWRRAVIIDEERAPDERRSDDQMSRRSNGENPHFTKS